uniref:[Pyruvate dehydrogenase [acetyl-transferring]]-phosphatase 1, mitochondrial n=3 Tax=Equus TaxID=9789 RepID=A0A5F5PN82_HORSE
MRTASPRPRYQDSRKPAQRGIVGARSRSRRPRSCTRGDAGADLGASPLPNHRQAGHLRPAPPPLAPNTRAAPPSTGGRARSREAGPCNQWAARAEWKGLSDPRDVTKLARGAVRFRPRPPLASSPPTRHCAANRKTGSAPARTFGRGRVAARRSRGAEWAGRGRGASLRGVVPACVEGAPGSAAAASSSRRSGFFPGVPGIPVRSSSLPLFSDAMPGPTQLFFPLIRNCELSRIYGTACYCHHKHLCCSSPYLPQSRLRYTSHPAYATFCRPKDNWWQYTQGRRYASTPQKFYLTPPQVNSILKANEYSFKVPEFDGKNVSSVLGFDSNQLPANAPIEDRRSAATCLQTRGMLLGVFDGHAGCACSQAVSERLFYYIAVSLLPHETLLEIENAVESGRALLPILQWHKHPNDYFSKEASKLYFNSLRTYWQELIDLNTGESTDIDVKEALINAFKRLDNDISLEAQVGDPNSFLNYLVLRVAFSGATACVAHVDGVDLHVANTGDSRAMLGVQEEDGSWSAVTLSNDHNAQNERELERLKLEHPKNEAKSVVKQDRLLGLLMPFRAFGDVKFKWSIDLQKRVIESGPDQLNDNEYTKFIPPNYYTPPYLTAEPEVTYHRLRPQDKFLVLATDGLWETMHRQDVVRIVGEYLTGMHHQQPIAVGGYKVTLGQMHGLLTERRAKMSSVFEDQNAATHLIRHAVGNNEFGAVDHERLSKMLSLPEELARMYRDDITIIVVQFNSHVVGAYQNQE